MKDSAPEGYWLHQQIRRFTAYNKMCIRLAGFIKKNNKTEAGNLRRHAVLMIEERFTC